MFTDVNWSLLYFSAKPCIAKGNLENCIQYGLNDNYQLFIYTCQILENIGKEEFKRYWWWWNEIIYKLMYKYSTFYIVHFRLPNNHELVVKILKACQKSFTDCGVDLFNDVASNAINIIYKVCFVINILK